MSDSALTPADANSELLRELDRHGIDVRACYQCGRCSAGCPISKYMDLLPMQIVRLAAYGFETPLVGSHTIWLCAGCETCTTRCPNDIDIAGLMDVLRAWALKHGHKPAEPNVPIFHQAFLNSVRRWGRTFELGMLGGYKMKSGDLFSDMALGMKMFRQGKLHLLPKGIKGKQEVRKLFDEKSGKEDKR